MFFSNAIRTSWPIPFQKNNRVRNPETQNLSIIHCTAYSRLHWTTSHSKSTFIEFGWVRITNSLSRSERVQNESEMTRNRWEWKWLTEFKAEVVSRNGGESLTFEMNRSAKLSEIRYLITNIENLFESYRRATIASGHESCHNWNPVEGCKLVFGGYVPTTTCPYLKNNQTWIKLRNKPSFKKICGPVPAKSTNNYRNNDSGIQNELIY
jgi:hypothetical protein